MAYISRKNRWEVRNGEELVIGAIQTALRAYTMAKSERLVEKYAWTENKVGISKRKQKTKTKYNADVLQEKKLI